MRFHPNKSAALLFLVASRASAFLTLRNINQITNTTLDCTRWVAEAAVINDVSRDTTGQGRPSVSGEAEEAEDVSSRGSFFTVEEKKGVSLDREGDDF